ncbi:hypothetical protein, partial [uncultured Pseudoalteromonas sp.]
NDMTSTATLAIPGNITVIALDDMVTEEYTSISFEVQHIDEMNSRNEISVIADNASYEVDGDTVTITPEQYFYGDIDVTVVVSDIENPTDKAETSFVLTVNSDGVDKPTAVTPESKEKGGSSGSLAWITVLLAGFAGLRRRMKRD